MGTFREPLQVLHSSLAQLHLGLQQRSTQTAEFH
uniref:Uncharacterized protein n=1 Tax=Anguilla anguilla TaxID=7936 RepID=A0A0E9UM64_ANGAN